MLLENTLIRSNCHFWTEIPVTLKFFIHVFDVSRAFIAIRIMPAALWQRERESERERERERETVRFIDTWTRVN